MNTGEKITYLLRPETRELLGEIMSDSRDDLALSQWLSQRGLRAEQRQALLEQRLLRSKAERKTSRAGELIFTALGLEQLTPEALARYKMSRLPSGLRTLADLCCGLGGDSWHAPEQVQVVGVDWEAAPCLAYLHNSRIWRNKSAAVLGDVVASPVRADAALLDPARRSGRGRPGWDENDLSPGWSEVEKLLKRYKHMILKLPPGAQVPDFLEDAECEYLGWKDQCLELCVWTGDLGSPGKVRATELPGGTSVEAYRDSLADSFGEPREPGEYLYEPVKAVVRSHLFGVLAEQCGLWPIDSTLAYLSGNHRLDHPLLKGYRLLKSFGANWKEIQLHLRRENVGRLEIKKRGWNLTPEEVRLKLRPSGEAEGTLIFARVLGRKIVFFAEALGRSGQAGE